MRLKALEIVFCVQALLMAALRSCGNWAGLAKKELLTREQLKAACAKASFNEANIWSNGCKMSDDFGGIHMIEIFLIWAVLITSRLKWHEA